MVSLELERDEERKGGKMGSLGLSCLFIKWILVGLSGILNGLVMAS